MGKLEDFYGVQEAARLRREYGFGAPPTAQVVTQLDDAQRALLKAKMETILAALEGARRQAVNIATGWPAYNWVWLVASAFVPGLVGVVGTFATPGEAKAAVLGNLNGSISMQIENGRKAMAEVLAGTLPVEKWMEGRRWTAEGIKVMLQSLGENSVAGNMMTTLNGVWSDISTAIEWIAKKAREVPGKLPDTSTMIYAILALGAFVVYQYLTAPLRLLPQKRLSGYNSPRRKRRRRS